jgi:hypothetical protein
LIVADLTSVCPALSVIVNVSVPYAVYEEQANAVGPTYSDIDGVKVVVLVKYVGDGSPLMLQEYV